MTKETKGTSGADKTVGGIIMASEEEAAAFELKPYLVKCMLEEPFYSKVLRTITKIRTDDIPTAGVLSTDGDIRMWWNPRFFAALPVKHVLGVLKHECLHLVFEHTTTRKHTPHLIWNYATDLAINSHLDGELPAFGLMPGRAFPELTEEDMEKMDEKGIARRQQLSDLIESFPTCQASEWYFGRLMESDAVKEALEDLENGENDGDGEGGLGGMPGTMDDHGGWDEMSEEDREFIKAKIKQAASEAQKECDSKGSWGTVPAELRAQIREALSNEVPWQAILKRFVGYSRRANRMTSWSKIHSSYGAIAPGVKRGYQSSVAVYVDQSGSVGNDELELLFAELRMLAKKTEFATYHFDTEIDEDSKQVWKRGKTPTAHRTRSGGTCFKAPTKHANKNKRIYDGYIILTDGYAPQPGPSHLPRAWVITPDGQVPDWMSNSKDVVIKMGWPVDKTAAAAA